MCGSDLDSSSLVIGWDGAVDVVEVVSEVEVGRSRMAIMPTLSADGGGRVSSDDELGRSLGSGTVARSAASYVRGSEEVEEGWVYLSLLSHKRVCQIKLKTAPQSTTPWPCRGWCLQ